MVTRITCSECHEDRRAVTLWKQIVALDPDTVCCWPVGLVDR